MAADRDLGGRPDVPAGTVDESPPQVAVERSEGAGAAAVFGPIGDSPVAARRTCRR
ncbi:hypothetical protein AB0M91_18580 [Micromonospora rifamycinica]|uniref:hypothetical protein n=1 Tax=Micromonospora rifamycinica TaxID=291594 RepID=UPI0034451DDF